MNEDVLTMDELKEKAFKRLEELIIAIEKNDKDAIIAASVCSLVADEDHLIFND